MQWHQRGLHADFQDSQVIHDCADVWAPIQQLSNLDDCIQQPAVQIVFLVSGNLHLIQQSLKSIVHGLLECRQINQHIAEIRQVLLTSLDITHELDRIIQRLVQKAVN
jgi:hypothetical protein